MFACMWGILNKVDDRAEKAARFFVTCEANPDSRESEGDRSDAGEGVVLRSRGCRFDAADAGASRD